MLIDFRLLLFYIKIGEARNRLIAAYCSKLLVAEATEKSGALITAEYAKKYGKEVYAVPNSIYSRESLGCNKFKYFM